MFRFKQFLLILEDRLSYLKAKQEPEFHHIIDHYAEHVDPTEGKEYTQKLLSWHKAGIITPKDSHHLNETLSEFHKLKKIKGRLQKTDINAYKTPVELEDAVVGNQGTSGKGEDARIKKEEVEHIHSENGVTITSPKTEAASCLLGKNTKWCTTWTGVTPSGQPKNMFNTYNKDGPLYVIDTPSGKYQYHEASDQFKNAEDEEVSMQKVALQHPEMITGLRKVGLGHNLITNREELEKKLKSGTGTYSEKQDLIRQHPLVTSEDITKVLNDRSTDIGTKEAATEHPTAFTKEHLDALLADRTVQFPSNESLVHHALSRSKAVTEDHVTNILKDPEESTERKVSVLENPHGAVQSHHVDYMLKNTSPTNEDHTVLRAQVMSSTGVEPHHIEQILNNPDEPHYVKRAALANKALTSEQAKKVLNGNDQQLKNTVITHPTAIGPEDIDKYFSEKPNSYVIEGIINSSPAFRPHHIDKIINDTADMGKKSPLATNAMQAIKSRTATPENIDNLLSKSSSDFDTAKLKKFAFSQSPALRPEHIDKVINDASSNDDDSLVLNQPLIEAGLQRKDVVEPHHIDKILANPDLADDHLRSVIKSPALTSEHIGRILKDPDVYNSDKKELLEHPKLLPSHVDHVLNDPEMGNDMKRRALEHPTAVRSRHLDQLLSDPYPTDTLQTHAIYHPTALKPRHIDKILDRPENYSNFVMRGIFNQFSKANAVLPRHITKVLHNPDKYEPEIVDMAVNHPVTKQMASATT